VGICGHRGVLAVGSVFIRVRSSAHMDAVYDRIGIGYAARRRPDARIAARIEAALAGCDTLANVGGGTGSYEPVGRTRVAVEPSSVMIAQLHHWADWRAGVAELVRISRRRVVLLSWDPACAGAFWLVRDYLPEIAPLDAAQFPTLAAYDAALPGAAVETVPVPHDCSDGFLGAYWRRPEAYLDADVRRAISTFPQLPAARVTAALARLRDDLASGRWAERHADLLARDSLDLGYRLIVWRRNRRT